MARSPKPGNDEPVLQVTVYSAEQVFYRGGAKSVSAINAEGAFDVLARHVRFFSLLAEGDVVVNTGDERIVISISHGILHVRNDEVTVFVFGLVEPDAEDPPQ